MRPEIFVCFLLVCNLTSGDSDGDDGVSNNNNLCDVTSDGAGDDNGGNKNLCPKPPPRTKTSMELFADLRAAVDAIRSVCGETCDTTMRGTPDKYFDRIEKTVDCESVLGSDGRSKLRALVDRRPEFDRPLKRSEIPKALLPDFTYQWRVTSSDMYLDESKGGGHSLLWTKAMVANMRAMYRGGGLRGPYGQEAVESIKSIISSKHMNVSGQHVLVLGSQTPWIEALLLESGGARHVTTVDYAKIVSEAPRITTVTPSELSDMHSDGSLPKFDSLVSFSSLEHSGLGRYGDALNPWGDLLEMSRAFCLLDSGGRALVGVPVGPEDRLEFNAHRVYGPVMLPHLFANWKQVYSQMDLAQYADEFARSGGCAGCYQPLFVMEKP